MMKMHKKMASLFIAGAFAVGPVAAFGQSNEPPPEPPNEPICNGVTCETLICDPIDYTCDTYTYPDTGAQAPPDDRP